MSSPSLPVRPAVSSTVLSGRNAVAVVFAANGFAFSSWASRLPAIREGMHLTPSQLGLVLLAVSVASVASMPFAGSVVDRLGPTRAVLVASALCLLGLAGVGLAPSVPWLLPALALVGLGTAQWDVAMNVEGADVERALGRSVMPRFHAAFSLGTVAGAAVGSVAAGTGLGTGPHLVLAAVACLLVTLAFAGRFASRTAPAALPATGPAAGAPQPRGGLDFWREPRTLLIGVLALGMAFAEGSANDWLAVGLVDGYGAGQALAAAGFGVFVTAMTVGRLVGPWVLDRWGRVPVLRVGAVLALAGVGLVNAGARAGLVPVMTALAVLGAVTWGLGAALGFPVAMSAAADDQRYAAARVSVVATIGYTAFLAGPPLLGLLGDHIGVLAALSAVGVAVALALLAAGAARPLPQAGTPRPARSDPTTVQV